MPPFCCHLSLIGTFIFYVKCVALRKRDHSSIVVDSFYKNLRLSIPECLVKKFSKARPWILEYITCICIYTPHFSILIATWVLGKADSSKSSYSWFVLQDSQYYLRLFFFSLAITHFPFHCLLPNSRFYVAENSRFLTYRISAEVCCDVLYHPFFSVLY